jgi:hypothetical protein
LRGLADRLGTTQIRRTIARIWRTTGIPRQLRLLRRRPVIDETGQWVRANLPWYAVSMTVHMVSLTVAMLVLGQWYLNSRPSVSGFVPVDDDLSLTRQLSRLEFNDAAPLVESSLDVQALLHPERLPVPAEYNDKSKEFHEAGGGKPGGAGPDGVGGGFAASAESDGPRLADRGGIGAGSGLGAEPGSGGAGNGFGGRGSGSRRALAAMYGGSRNTELAVIAALDWLSRHRNSNGSWSLGHFNGHCVGTQCSGPGSVESDVAATSLALLPFLAAGETSKTHGPYHELVNQGLYWLMKKQGPDGDLSAKSQHMMYTHALATITLCEAYGMTKDPKIGDVAQRAVMFIERAQIQRTGGWRYIPNDPTGGDTSVLGWQIMALHSAQLAGLSVNTQTLENAKKWLAAVSKGSMHGMFAYQPYKNPTPTMTAIGMLSWQYLGMRADDSAMVEGKHYLLQNLPENGMRNTYYWYYGTQVMHNLLGKDWDAWNRPMRRALIETQCHAGCAAGSWDPENPTLDAWSEQGGRIVTTAFSTLTLEIYYRYLPLYGAGRSPSDPEPTADPNSATSITAPDAAAPPTGESETRLPGAALPNEASPSPAMPDAAGRNSAGQNAVPPNSAGPNAAPAPGGMAPKAEPPNAPSPFGD